MMQCPSIRPGLTKPGLARRRFLQFGTMAAVAGLFPKPILAAVDRILTPEKHLSFYNTHTGEALEICYFRQGHYCSDGLTRINYILRDHRSGEIKPISTRLLDLLYDISATLQTHSPFHVISGYRSATTNTSLRRKSKNVAAYSLHLKGKAVDIRLPGCRTQTLRKAAVNLRKGGVGLYRRLDFVHVDVGRVRYW